MVYDAAGRMAATRVNADPWTCVAYDARGRLVNRAVPAIAGMAGGARTVAYSYAGLVGDPRVVTVSDPAGTITTNVDLLGRTTSYADAFGNTTTSAYDQPGRLVETVGRDGTRHTDFDAAGRRSAQLPSSSTGPPWPPPPTTPAGSWPAWPMPTAPPCRPSAATAPGG